MLVFCVSKVLADSGMVILEEDLAEAYDEAVEGKWRFTLCVSGEVC